MFKEIFKQFKSKKNPPNMCGVYNFNSERSISYKVRPYATKSNLLKVKNSKLNYFGLKPPETWSVYEIIEKPGVIFIKNPFTSLGQRYWICRCLNDYTKKPHKSNLDSIIQNGDEFNNIFESDLLQKLRWITLGYHHNWNTKVYDDKNKDVFPSDLSQMCEYVAEVLNFDHFKAEAAIVNYYHMDSTLSGHTDHSEHNLNAPLFSFSFGQTAVFLVGGLTKDEAPLAMFLNSGDIVIMANESRLSYHAVPCILKTTDETWNVFNYCCDENSEENIMANCNSDIFNVDLINKCKDLIYFKPFHKYLQTSRININIRQVY